MIFCFLFILCRSNNALDHSPTAPPQYFQWFNLGNWFQILAGKYLKAFDFRRRGRFSDMTGRPSGNDENVTFDFFAKKIFNVMFLAFCSSLLLSVSSFPPFSLGIGSSLALNGPPS